MQIIGLQKAYRLSEGGDDWLMQRHQDWDYDCSNQTLMSRFENIK